MERFVLLSFISVIPVIIFILIVIFLIGVVRRMKRRADERLRMDKDNATLLQQQIQEINNRLTNIEKTLNEVQ